ncbi:MAG TPA: hypothetical protein VLH10_10935, partial [Yinghuangia sp.]|nr:hypothetical protein [Yinghuangia sp.]
MPGQQTASARVAFATCAALPDLDDDEAAPIAPLAARGVRAEPVVWNEPGVDWDAFDLVVIRATWDFVDHRPEFVAWAQSVPRLANSADIVRWGTDKTYLRDIAAAGVPVADTTWLTPGIRPILPNDGVYVVKPSVSCGSRDTGRYDLRDAAHRDLAADLVDRLLADGRTVMVQPYLHAVDTVGETGLVFIGGRFSHAIRKGAMLDGPAADIVGLYKPEKITRRVPSDAELRTARRVLAAVPGGPEALLYARVDLIPDADGTPTLLELEAVDPTLFLSHDDGAAE